MAESERFTTISHSGPELRWNWKLFVATWVIGLILAPSIVFLHRWQRTNLATVMMQRAEACKDKQDWLGAITNLEQYLAYKKDDTAVQIELIELYDRATTFLPDKKVLVTQYLTAIGKCESDPILRKRIPGLRLAAIKLQMELGNFEDAIQQIARLAGPTPDPKVERLLALCRFRLAASDRQDRWDETSQSVAPEWIWPLGSMQPVDLLLQALDNTPGDPELTLALANAILGEPRLIEKSKLALESRDSVLEKLTLALDGLLQRNPDDAIAWVTFISIALQTDPEKATQAISTAVEKFPNNAAVLKTAGQFYLERAQAQSANTEVKDQDLARSKELFQKLLESKDPLQSKDPLVFAFLGDIELERGADQAAIQVWNEGIKAAYPPTAYLHFRKVKNLLQRKNSTDAYTALRAMDEAIAIESINVNEAAVEPILKSKQKLWGAYYIAENDYLALANLLNDLAAGTAQQSPADRAEILAALADACMNASQWDRAGSAYEQALSLVPDEPAYLRGAATAWLRANRLSESLNLLQEIPNKTRQDWFQLAVISLSMQIAGIPEAETWQIFDKAIAKATESETDSSQSNNAATSVPSKDRIAAWQLELLRMEAQMMRTESSRRQTLATEYCQRIVDLCKGSPNVDAIWNQGARLMRRWNRAEAAEQLTALYMETRPDSIPAVIAQAKREAEQGDLASASQRLFDRLQTSPGEDALLQELLLLSDSPIEQTKTLERLIPWCGKDALRLMRLCSIAVELPILERDQDPSEIARLKKSIERWSAPRIELEQALKGIEGDQGSEWKALMARRLLAQAQVDLTMGLEQLDAILRDLQVNRPLWTTTHILEGLIAERRLESQRAIKAFQRAVALGDDSPFVFERLIRWMRSEGMVDEARELIEQLMEQGAPSQTIAAAAMELSLPDRDRLMDLAKLGIDSRPKDPMAWVWYAQVLDAQTRLLDTEERSASMRTIEDAFQRAESLSAGREVRVFNAMYEYFTATGQTSKVQELLERIRTSNALPPNIQWLFLGLAQHADGKFDLAESYYRLALKFGGDPREIGPMLSKALLQQGKPDACIDELDKLLQNDPSNARTRESLAIALALRGSQSDWERLVKLLTDGLNANTPEDRRTLSKLFAQRGLSRDVEQARSILEDLVLDPRQRTDEDCFRLASIYTNQAKDCPDTPEGQSEKMRLMQLADLQLQQVAMSSNAKTDQLATYGNFLLGQGRTRDADEVSKRLTLQAPKSSDAMLLRAKVLASTDHPENASQFIRSWVDVQMDALPSNSNPALRNQILAQASNAFFAIGAADDADPWLDTLLQQDSPLLLRLLFLLCQSPEPKIHTPAFDRFLAIFAANPKRELAFRVLQLLSSKRFRDGQLSEAERLLVQFQADHPEDPEFPVYIADYWIARQQWDQAIAALRTGVKLDPKNVFALNNLANLLGERPESVEEALQVIDQAIAVGGRQPNLLDTKGSILIQAGQFADACIVLEEAATNGVDPRILLHWYMALRGAGQNSAADSIKPRVDRQALRKMLLSTADRAALEELSR